MSAGATRRVEADVHRVGAADPGDAACDRLHLERAVGALAVARDGLKLSGRGGQAARVGRALEVVEEVHGEVEAEVFAALEGALSGLEAEGERGAGR